MSISVRYLVNCFIATTLAFIGTATAQESADKIIAVVGRSRIILKSDLERALFEMKSQGMEVTDTTRGGVLYQMIFSKMLLEQAERDSVLVTDEDVEGQLDNKLRYFIQYYGSKEKLEHTVGRTVYQIKEDNRDAVREGLIQEKMVHQLLENIKITPAEVTNFYKKIPVDSLPFFPAKLEVGQIVINPPVSVEMEEYAHTKLEEIRADIVAGKRSFEDAAIVNSMDPGSRDNGGRYDGVEKNGAFAPEFLAAAFKLQNGEISPIIKTKFGYHIILMISRKGDVADLRHILIKPEVTTADFKYALNRLDSLHRLLITGKLTFEEGVSKFSTDDAAKRTGGLIQDPTNGSTELDVTHLDPGMVLLIDSLNPGEYSKPHVFYNEMREQSCRIVYLKNRTAPHKANLKEDYNRIMEVALAQKKEIKKLAWVATNLASFYIKIDPEYMRYPEIRNLVPGTAGNQ